MKKIKFLSLTVLILLLSGCCPCWKDTSKKELFVIHIHGDWCKTCDKVDPVVHSLQSYFEESKIFNKKVKKRENQAWGLAMTGTFVSFGSMIAYSRRRKKEEKKFR